MACLARVHLLPSHACLRELDDREHEEQRREGHRPTSEDQASVLLAVCHVGVCTFGADVPLGYGPAEGWWVRRAALIRSERYCTPLVPITRPEWSLHTIVWWVVPSVSRMTRT